MILARRKVSENLAIASFGVIFLGYSVNYLLRFNPIASIKLPVGFSHLALASLILICLPSSLFHFRRFILVEFAFIFWIFFAIIFSLIAISFDFPTHSIVQQSLGYLQAVALWWTVRSVDRRSGKARVLAGLALLVCGLAVLSAPVEVDLDNVGLFSYHTSALVIFVSGFILCSGGTKVFRFTAGAIVSYFLYKNGARTEFGLFLLIYPIIVFGRLTPLFFLSWTLVAGLLLSAVIFFKDDVLSLDHASRIIGLIDISNDLSSTVRLETVLEGVNTIFDHPFLGSYASYQPGFYAHNLLSAWVDFGIFGFAVYLFCIFSITRSALIINLRMFSEDLSLAAFVVAFIMAIIFSKVYFHPMIGIAVGFVSAGYKFQTRKIQI